VWSPRPGPCPSCFGLRVAPLMTAPTVGASLSVRPPARWQPPDPTIRAVLPASSRSERRRAALFLRCASSPVPTGARPATGTVVNRLSFQQGEPEAGDALEEALEFGLVAYVAR
jgi:hypothetical protein